MTNEKTVELAIPVNERNHVIGLADAPVTVVNYGDYKCPDCHHDIAGWKTSSTNSAIG